MTVGDIPINKPYLRYMKSLDALNRVVKSINDDLYKKPLTVIRTHSMDLKVKCEDAMIKEMELNESELKTNP